MKVEKKFSDGRVIDNMNAVAVAEGRDSSDETPLNDSLAAWAYLIRTGLCWQLQGLFGRTASSLIENGIITPDGCIEWNLVDEMLEA